MSLVHLANACSHLQNASMARLGFTSLPRTNQLHSLMLQMQKCGYISNVTMGDVATGPPLPNAVNPIFSQTNLAANEFDPSYALTGAEDLSAHVTLPHSPPSTTSSSLSNIQPRGSRALGFPHLAHSSSSSSSPSRPLSSSSSPSPLQFSPQPISQTIPIARQRLWVGLKYHAARPVLERMSLISKPTMRIWMGVDDMDMLIKGERRGQVRGLRAIGEGIFVTTDRGIMEIREAVDRRTGGMLLCRVNHAKRVRV